MQVDSILETALYAENLEETALFYQRVLGIEAYAQEPGRHVFFKLNDHVLLLFNPLKTHIPAGEGDLPVPAHGAKGPGHVCFRLKSDQIQAWRDHLIQMQVDIEADFMWPGTGARSIYFRDPAGNSVELGEAKIWY